MEPQHREVMSALYKVFEALCEGSWSAVRVARVVNGMEFRFLVCVEAHWRPAVYAYLAEHTDIWVPPDGGALNLSAEQALSLGRLEVSPREQRAGDEQVTLITGAAPRHMPMDITGPKLQNTFQP